MLKGVGLDPFLFRRKMENRSLTYSCSNHLANRQGPDGSRTYQNISRKGKLSTIFCISDMTLSLLAELIALLICVCIMLITEIIS